MRLPSLALASMLVLGALAGCLGAASEPSQRSVAADAGKVSAGWAYDGVGLVAGGAKLDGLLDNEANAGLVNVSFAYGGSEYVVTFDQFAQAEGKDFMDGGVAFSLDEHGDSGVADASIPKIHAQVAAWGKASVTVDGAPATADAWSAHLMVSRDTVRGADGRMVNAAGSAPYNPASPGDATIVVDDAQVLFWIKHPMGESFQRAAASNSTSVAFAGPQTTTSVDFPAEKGATGATINYTITPGQLPVGAGELQIRVLNASGEPVVTADSGPILPGSAPAGSLALTAEQIDGPLTIELSGVGAFSVTLDTAVAYKDTPFLVVTWDEVVLS